MSTIHIDEKHRRLLEGLQARLASSGKELNTEDVIDKLIEDAANGEPLSSIESSSEIEQSRHKFKNLDLDLPISVPDDVELQEHFAGNYIAIQDKEIVVID